jgi:glutathione S-transferase
VEQITLHGFAPSTYTRTARMAADEKGVSYTLAPIAYGEPEHFALHPFGKMPILTNGGMTLFETLAIVAYFDGMSGAQTLFGADLTEKAQVLSAISVAIDYAYRDVVRLDVADGGLSEGQLSATARVFDWLEARLARSRHVASERLSAADLFFAPMLAYHAKEFGGDQIYPSRARLAAWMRDVEQRPSFLNTVE